MSPAYTRLAAFLVTFGPALLLMSARPATSESSFPVLQATVIGQGLNEGSMLLTQCGGTPLGKGWCGKLTCSSGNCSASWSPITNSRCEAGCISPSWSCCGWQINTSNDCGCVDDNPEPSNYSCGPCAKQTVEEI